MTEEEARNKVHWDPDFVNAKRYEYSLALLEERYPEGAPDNIIANALMIDEDDVEDLYYEVVAKLRHFMGVEL